MLKSEKLNIYCTCNNKKKAWIYQALNLRQYDNYPANRLFDAAPIISQIRAKAGATLHYYSAFVAIHAENRSPTMNSSIFDQASCDLGEMTTALGGNGTNVDTLLTIEEIKKFFSYFFVGGGFATRLPSEVYRFPKPGITDEFTTTLLQVGILEEHHAKGQMRYGVADTHKRPVQKFVNENNLNKQFRDVFKDFLGR